MTLKGLVSLVFNLIGLTQRPRSKDAPLPYLLSDPIVTQKIKQQQSSESNFMENSEGGWCCVCLSRLKDEDEIRVLPCLHKFHKICVNRWLKSHHKTCPLCRLSMGAEEKSHRSEMFTEEMLIWFSSFHIAGM
ncbi:Zinc finger, RING-type [Sesbania bispinosa]|nr:Zinc finger, RING-type [Sesbania bispinosa]